MSDTVAVPGIFAPLTDVEAKILELAGMGAPCEVDATAVASARQHLETVDGAGDSRVLRSVILQHLCANSAAPHRLGPSGLTLTNVTVEGDLDLAFTTVPFPLTFLGCTLKGTLNLQHAHLAHLKFVGGSVQRIKASGLRLDGDLVLEERVPPAAPPGGTSKAVPVTIPGGLELRNARLRGDFRLFGASLGDGTGYALNAEGIHIRGALTTCRRDVPGGGRTGALVTHGPVSLCDATVHGSIELTGARLKAIRGKKDHAEALAAGRLVVRGSMHLNDGFRADGDVRMVGCRIRNSLVCSGGRFTAYESAALSFDNARIGQAVFLNDGYRAKGKTRLVGAHIVSDLDCTRGRFLLDTCAHGEAPYALSAARVHVGGDVYLSHVHATAELRFRGARFGGGCAVDSLSVRRKAAPSRAGTGSCPAWLNLEGARVGTGLTVTGGACAGLLDMSGAEVGNDVVVRGLRLVAGTVGGIHARSARITGRLVWAGVLPTPQTEMTLAHAVIGRISHSLESWPEPGRLRLAGCTYAAIDFPSPCAVPRSWNVTLENGYVCELPRRNVPSEWVGLVPAKPYEPQPWEQLERVLLRSGDEDTAREVGIAKHEARLRNASMPRGDRAVARVLGMAIRHGYDSRPLAYAAAVILALGAVLFGTGSRHGLMTPSSPEVIMDSGYANSLIVPDDYPAFNFLVYSLDTFLPPVIDFHQESQWLPNPRRGKAAVRTPFGSVSAGSLLRGYLWIHIGAGWLFTSLLLVNLTGLIRKG